MAPELVLLLYHLTNSPVTVQDIRTWNRHDSILQYSPFITSHMRGIFSVGPRNFFRGKTENHAWHGDLPRVEKGFDTPRNSHAWQSKPLLRVANI